MSENGTASSNRAWTVEEMANHDPPNTASSSCCPRTVRRPVAGAISGVRCARAADYRHARIAGRHDDDPGQSAAPAGTQIRRSDQGRRAASQDLVAHTYAPAPAPPPPPAYTAP